MASWKPRTWLNEDPGERTEPPRGTGVPSTRQPRSQRLSQLIPGSARGHGRGTFDFFLSQVYRKRHRLLRLSSPCKWLLSLLGLAPSLQVLPPENPESDLPTFRKASKQCGAHWHLGRQSAADQLAQEPCTLPLHPGQRSHAGRQAHPQACVVVLPCWCFPAGVRGRWQDGPRDSRGGAVREMF